MDKIIFACPWQKNKELSWSGTHWALYNSLSEYAEMQDVDTGIEHSDDVGVSLYKKKRSIKSKLHILKNDMEISRMQFMEKRVQNQINDGKSPILQFEESPSVVGENKHYIYQDLCVGFLRKVYESDKELFDVCGFQGNPIDAIRKREKYQNDFYKKADGIFTMSKWLAEFLVKKLNLPKGKVHHVGGGCNIDVSRIDVSKKTGNKILFVGRDFKRKNGPLVVEAFKKAKAVSPEIELYIAGTNNVNIDYDGIHILGDISSEELTEYFNICDIFCMPSIFEAYGLVFPEALTFGLPCIGRDAYEMPHFIEENETGYLLKEDSPEELAKLMLNLLGNERIKANVLSKQQWYLQEYSWDTVAKRICSVMNKDMGI